MLWPAAELDLVYRIVVEDAVDGGCTVLVYVAQDCDALCACRILTTMLKADNVGYKIRPVRGSEDIVSDYKIVRMQEEVVRSIIMINCGGDLDLETVFGLDEKTFCYVLDARRPFNHLNLLPAARNTFVLVDEFCDEVRLKRDAKALEGVTEANIEEAFLPTSDDEDDDIDDENEDGDAKRQKNGEGSDEEAEDESDDEEEREFGASDNEKPKRRKLRKGKREKSDSEASDVKAPEEEGKEDQNLENDASFSNLGFSKEEAALLDKEVENEVALTTKRREMIESQDSISTGERKRSRSISSGSSGQSHGNEVAPIREKIQHYYDSVYWGAPASFIAFKIAQGTNKDSKMDLWLAIIGATFHYLENHLEQDDYHQFINVYYELVKDRTGQVERFTTQDSIRIPLAEQDRIEMSEELRLMLYRHWSLKESFFFSDYVAAKLGTWRTDGEAKLNTFFAKMGISLRESEQKFPFMNMKVKKELKEKINEHSEEFNLGEDLSYGSFQFRAGFNCQLSAADAVYVVSGLLEMYSVSSAVVAYRTESNQERVESAIAPDEVVAGNVQDGDRPLGLAARMKTAWQESFNEAYDFLDFASFDRNRDLLEHGLEMAKAAQKAVIEEGAAIISGRKISSAGDFRYCIMDGLAPKLASLFSQPQILLRLANFIMHAHTCTGKWLGLGAKPLVVAMKSSGGNVTHVVGISASEFGTVKRNSFGRHFVAAAKLIEVPCYTSGYDSASVEIHIDQIQRFLLALHEVVSSSA